MQSARAFFRCAHWRLLFSRLRVSSRQIFFRKQTRLRRKGRSVWRYVALPEENQAVVTGYDGPDAEALDVPSTLDDLDVVGLTAGALSGVQGLRQVTLPLQVLAIGANALPRGAVVRSNSGVYVQTWAQRNGYAFSTSSSYDFVRGVVDLTGTLPEHFVRVSSEEIWLRPLEAAQVSVGTRFFLLDPGSRQPLSDLLL